jgi:hypothetical protein
MLNDLLLIPYSHYLKFHFDAHYFIFLVGNLSAIFAFVEFIKLLNFESFLFISYFI